MLYVCYFSMYDDTMAIDIFVFNPLRFFSHSKSNACVTSFAFWLGIEAEEI